MEDNMKERSVPGIGLANTLRFAWRAKEVEPFGREVFGRTIIMGVLKLAVKDVLCLQNNPMERGFDVTVYTEEKHDEVLKKVKAVEGERPMCLYDVTSLARTNFRVVTVTMYNPHVKDEDVRSFLGRYMDKVSSARLLKDSLGFWNGRRCFQALLREDSKGQGGYLHPPAMFSLGADRGTLYYARQPPFCRRCMAYGHILASCSIKKCRICGSAEHEAKECDEPKACHGCGSSAHLWRECPVRHRSYASAAGGSRSGGWGKERRERKRASGPGHGSREENSTERGGARSGSRKKQGRHWSRKRRKGERKKGSGGTRDNNGGG
uniref:CCHC-type domain-containing protein n=1 Tax=Oncorhynchus tshawytscha TaxID=74940 RepID=A0AAZ3R488_ONCTS